ncbi:MAG: prolipoprotein diacylglyceryl transferase [Blautia sp.]
MKNELFSIGPFTVHGYGLMIALGILVCIAMGMYRARKKSMSDEAVLDIAIFSVLFGFVGAKALYVIVEFPDFLKNPMSVLGSEGFVVYGGIITGVLAAMIYCRIKHLKFLEYFDLLAPSVALAQGFGRIGCLLAGCCYGKETNAFWGITFPEGSLAPSGVKLIPTQLLSSAGDFLIMFLLLTYSKHSKKTGNVGFLYMLLYGVGRFFLEFLRSDDRGAVGILSTSQFISIGIILLAFILFFKDKLFPKKVQNTPEA